MNHRLAAYCSLRLGAVGAGSPRSRPPLMEPHLAAPPEREETLTSAPPWWSVLHCLSPILVYFPLYHLCHLYLPLYCPISLSSILHLFFLKLFHTFVLLLIMCHYSVLSFSIHDGTHWQTHTDPQWPDPPTPHPCLSFYCLTVTATRVIKWCVGLRSASYLCRHNTERQLWSVFPAVWLWWCLKHGSRLD